jgi:effector-binding domain-containing protein
MAEDIQIKEIQAQPVLCIKAVTTPAEIGSTFQRLLPRVGAHLKEAGIAIGGSPYGRYFSYTPDRVDMEAGIPVATPAKAVGEIISSELPAGLVVSAMHIGPYETLPHEYEELQAWMASHGKQISGAPWEFYWTDPGEEPDQSKWRTEILWPVR